MSNLLQRAAIALTLGPLALYLIYRGGLFYFVPLALILLLATAEYVHLIRRLDWLPSMAIMVGSSLLFYLSAEWGTTSTTSVLMVAALLIAMAYALWLYESREDGIALPSWLAMVAGIVLLGWLASHFFYLRGIETMAWQWTVLVIVSTWLADSAAYVVGKFLAGRVLGKHQLSPRLSPNKTVEGYFGGVLLGTTFTVLAAYLLQLPLLVAAILGLLISVLGPIGDLGISLLKREAGQKDSGRTFGSHGGALDRVDTLIWTVSIGFYLISYYYAYFS
ncbi:MAG: phosphatidate cytidylyltransferase [Candidatus Promineifilaceae bacterium]